MVEKKYEEIFLQARCAELYPYKEHYCYRELCDPQNETALRRRGLIHPSVPIMTNDDVFLCRYGDWHICSVDTCMNDEICHISGASMGIVQQYSSYDPNDARTYKDSPIHEKKNKNPEVEDIMETMIETLLFSSYRNTINEEWKNKKRKIGKKQKDNYVHEQCHQLPINLVGLAMLETKTLSLLETPPLTILNRDKETIRYYKYIVRQVYELVKTYSGDNKICVQSITIATLYKMQQSIVIDGVTILPVDEFLVKHLPLMNDLGRFKVDKRKYTRGERLIDQSIREATKNQVPLTDIAIVSKEEEEEEIIFKPSARF